MNSYTFRKINFAFKAIFARVVLYRVFSLDVFPVTLNDILTYLKKAMSYKCLKESAQYSRLGVSSKLGVAVPVPVQECFIAWGTWMNSATSMSCRKKSSKKNSSGLLRV